MWLIQMFKPIFLILSLVQAQLQKEKEFFLSESVDAEYLAGQPISKPLK